MKLSTTQVDGVIVVMGVSGCGKSSVAKLIAEQLGADFLEADALHPAENIRKMSTGTPLTDSDREPWLQKVRDEASKKLTKSRCCVVACSALKHQYRIILRDSGPVTRFVYLTGPYKLIASRMQDREGHFMPTSLLDSQLDTLESPEAEDGVVTLSIDNTPQEIATIAVRQLKGLANL